MSKYWIRAQVLSQETIGEGIHSLWLQADPVAREAVPGQFVNLYCRESARLLPRPISICQADPETGRIRLVYRVAGKGTAEFATCRPGDALRLMGPLGNGFPLTSRKALIVGGGIGVPPLLELAKQLPGEKCLVMGYRSETYLEEELAAAGRLVLATEDGSKGTQGTVMDAIRVHDLSADILYACGPTPMLRALKAFGEEKGIETWLSLEERMACGVGACLACVCRSTQVDEHTHVCNKRVCKEGPVFRAEEVEL